MDIIKKTDDVLKIETILQKHGLTLSNGLNFYIEILLYDYDYIEIYGYKKNAYFKGVYHETAKKIN